MSNTDYKNRIFSKLIGEGGLGVDFNPYGPDKTVNIEARQILTRLIDDEAFCDELTQKLVDVYFDLCSKRGLDVNKPNMFDRVMTVQVCDEWARFYGKQMLNKNYNEIAQTGRR